MKKYQEGGPIESLLAQYDIGSLQQFQSMSGQQLADFFRMRYGGGSPEVFKAELFDPIDKNLWENLQAPSMDKLFDVKQPEILNTYLDKMKKVNFGDFAGSYGGVSQASKVQDVFGQELSGVMETAAKTRSNIQEQILNQLRGYGATAAQLRGPVT